MVKTTFSPQLVDHVAKLANLQVNQQQQATFAQAFSETLDVINNLTSVDIAGVEPTAQTTGLENVWRDDVITPSFTQAEALQNATASADGYFVVERILHHDE